MLKGKYVVIVAGGTDVMVRKADMRTDAYLINHPFEMVCQGKRRELISVPRAEDVQEYCKKMNQEKILFITGGFEKPMTLGEFVYSQVAAELSDSTDIV